MMLMWGVDRSSGIGGHSTEVSAEEFADGNWSDAQAAVPITGKDPSWGSRTAPVTVVIYSDYECPYCSKAEPTLAALREKYGPDKLRMVWKNFPLPMHRNALPAHIAGQTIFELGGSKAFWKFHDLAFQNNRNLTPENFESWAEQAGVDRAKFKAAFAEQKGKAKVDEDVAGGQKVGVRGTPAFFINGIFISGARPQDAFEAEIDKQIAEAKKLTAAGTPPDQIYVKLTNQNKAKTPDAEKPPEEDDKTVWKVTVSKEEPFKGNAEALVTIVE
ncbi:MAG TPA: thioredoxin domain-containing protein, partial [Polyangiaceae bacterium]|nr:thioredoxin domain-containing protein [Polyangiaceae bacterium]